jgi:hypothetical protein
MRAFLFRLLSFMALLLPSLADAYIGPGVGLTAIGSFLALLGALLMLVVGFLWYPIKRLLKRDRQVAAQGASRIPDPES